MREARNYRINLIEAYDQPWKRQLEGTVGGHWGLFDAYRRNAKFSWGGNVSNHPYWEWQAASGAGLAAAIFAAAFVSLRRGGGTNRPTFWLRIAVIAVVSGSLIGWSVENGVQESFGAGGWLRSFGWASVALFLPICSAAALGSGAVLPAFAQVMNLRPGPCCRAVALGIGILLTILVLLAVPAALALVFDPRYRDFPFAPLVGAAVPLLFLARWTSRPKAPTAELTIAATIGISAVYIVLNEGFANWQACWFCLGLLILAFILLRAPCAPG